MAACLMMIPRSSTTMGSFPNYDLNATLGACYLGTIVASVLYGITNVQTYVYYKRSKHDHLALKCLVLLLWILDSVHLAFLVHAVYTYTVTNFANPTALMKPLWCVTAHVLVSSASDLAVRGVFCQRVFKLSGRNWFITVAITASSLLAFASGWGFAIWGFDVGDYYVLSKLSYFLYINLVSGLAADTLIATSLCLFLSRHQTGSSRTNSIVRLLMVYSINTGILTSLCAFACLIIYAVLPLSKKFAFSAIYFVLPKLLLNALLATLNARQGLREKSATGVVPISLAAPSDSHFTANNGSEYSQPRERQLVEIQAQTTTDVRLECIPYVIEKGSGTYTPPAPLFATADTYAI